VTSFFPARWYGKTVFLNSYHSVVRLDSLQRIFQALVYLLGDALVSITPPDRLFFPFRQIYDIKNGCFIPNGFPVKRIVNAEPALPAGIQSDPDETLLLFVGRLSPEKNIPLLLQSMQRLSGEYRGLKLVLCGEGRSRDLLQKQVHDLAIDKRVYFLGYQEEVFPIMKACDLLVLPSFREGMGNVIFEALAAGLPVIASKIPALEYWFGDREIVSLFDPFSVDEISACIRKELQRPEDEKDQRREAGQRLVSGLDIAVMVRKYTDLYIRLLHRNQETS